MPLREGGELLVEEAVGGGCGELGLQVALTVPRRHRHGVGRQYPRCRRGRRGGQGAHSAIRQSQQASATAAGCVRDIHDDHIAGSHARHAAGYGGPQRERVHALVRVVGRRT